MAVSREITVPIKVKFVYEPHIDDPCGCSEVEPNPKCCTHTECCCLTGKGIMRKAVRELKKGDNLAVFGEVLAVSASFYRSSMLSRAISVVSSNGFHQVFVLGEDHKVSLLPTGVLEGQHWTSERQLRVEKPAKSIFPEGEDNSPLVWISVCDDNGEFHGIYVDRNELRETLRTPPEQAK